MLLLNNILGTLFLDWSPFDPVRRILSSVGLSDSEVEGYEAPFDEFRHQEAGVPLRLPENIRTSDEWFRLLFHPTLPESVERKEGGIAILEYGKPNQGYIGQINLDNIGRDFLCLIYYRQRILDLWRAGGLTPVLSDLFRPRGDNPPEFTNLNNSLIPIEALTDVLTLGGAEFPTERGSDPMIVLSDPPTRHLTLGEIPSFVSMLRDSSNLSRFIRSLSVLLQDGGRWDHLKQVSLGDFNLDEEFTLLRDRRRTERTRRFCLDIAMTREFALWDIHRDERLPSIRQISDRLGVPYLSLLRILMFREDNSKEAGIHQFRGLEFLTDGFSDRLVQTFLRDLGRVAPEKLLTSKRKPTIL